MSRGALLNLSPRQQTCIQGTISWKGSEHILFPYKHPRPIVNHSKQIARKNRRKRKLSEVSGYQPKHSGEGIVSSPSKKMIYAFPILFQ